MSAEFDTSDLRISLLSDFLTDVPKESLKNEDPIEQLIQQQTAPPPSITLEESKKKKVKSSVNARPRNSVWKRSDNNSDESSLTPAVHTAEKSLRTVQKKPTAGDDDTGIFSHLHPKLKRGMSALGIVGLTQVQREAWGPMMTPAQDVLIKSETGSGKTLAYALPALHSLLHRCDTEPITRAHGTAVLVLAPTRELVLQCSRVFQKLTVGAASFMVVGSIHGGDDRHHEKARLRKGIHILVATPGRLLDHLRTTSAFIHTHLDTFVMDEADRLLDLGFESTLTAILQVLTPARKRVLVSATITAAIQRLSHFALQDSPAMVGDTEDTFNIPVQLKQRFMIVPCRKRLPILAAVLLRHLAAGCRKLLVFISSSDSVEFHHTLFSRAQNPFTNDLTAANNRGSNTIVPSASLFDCHLFKLHGNMSQIDRASVFRSFAQEPQGILFCTDVASRGLDLPKVDGIVHLDPPQDERIYVHRIGRTARIGQSGFSLLFLMPHEKPLLSFLSRRLLLQEETEGMMEADSMLSYAYHLLKLDTSNGRPTTERSSRSKANTDVDIAVSKLHSSLVQTVSKDPELSHRSALAFQSFVRAYNAFSRSLRSETGLDPSFLHLGMVAHSFATRAEPTKLHEKTKQTQLSKEKTPVSSLSVKTYKRDKYDKERIWKRKMKEEEVGDVKARKRARGLQHSFSEFEA